MNACRLLIFRRLIINTFYFSINILKHYIDPSRFDQVTDLFYLINETAKSINNGYKELYKKMIN